MDVASSLKALVFAADIPATERPVNHAVNVEQGKSPGTTPMDVRSRIKVRDTFNYYASVGSYFPNLCNPRPAS